MPESNTPTGDFAGVERALNRIAAATETGNSELAGIKTELADVKTILQTHSRALEQIAQSNIGQWECCLNSGNKAEALLAVSLKSFDKTPPERFDEYAAATTTKGA